ncbi:unnamed protein product [Lathyrus oleraceus]
MWFCLVLLQVRCRIWYRLGMLVYLKDLVGGELLANCKLWLLYCRMLAGCIWTAPFWPGPCLSSCSCIASV